jgi:hypothetical protein
MLQSADSLRIDHFQPARSHAMSKTLPAHMMLQNQSLRGTLPVELLMTISHDQLSDAVIVPRDPHDTKTFDHYKHLVQQLASVSVVWLDLVTEILLGLVGVGPWAEKADRAWLEGTYPRAKLKTLAAQLIKLRPHYFRVMKYQTLGYKCLSALRKVWLEEGVDHMYAWEMSCLMKSFGGMKR